MGAERSGDQARLDRADALLGVDRKCAEGDELVPHAPALLIGCRRDRLGSRPLASEQRLDRLAQPALLVCQVQVHGYC